MFTGFTTAAALEAPDTVLSHQADGLRKQPAHPLPEDVCFLDACEVRVDGMNTAHHVGPACRT